MCPPEAGWSEDSNENVKMVAEKEYAAVSIVVGQNKIIIEKRSSTDNDPWSGQFSLPGGHYSQKDSILKETALRETREETGVDLRENSKYLGHFGPFTPGNRKDLEVYAYVFEIPEPVELISSPESEFLIWVDLSDFRLTNGVYGEEFKIKEGIVWGLTARIIERFLKLYKKDAL
ncbi:MAG: NUDIX domain-containing protein [Thermoplasmatales archaeon]